MLFPQRASEMIKDVTKPFIATQLGLTFRPRVMPLIKQMQRQVSSRLYSNVRRLVKKVH